MFTSDVPFEGAVGLLEATPEPEFFIPEDDPGQEISDQIVMIWTPVLGKRYTPISYYFLEHYSAMDITGEEAMFIIHLVQHKWFRGHAFPSYKRLAALMGVSLNATRRYARDLEKKGFIKRIPRDRGSNLFSLEPLFVALENRVAQVLKKRAMWALERADRAEEER